MKRIFVTAIMIGLIGPSVTCAQGGLFREFGEELRQRGREIIRQELGSQPGFQQGGQQGDQPRAMGALPSEGGQNSGGGSQRFRPGDGGFMLPGGGGQIQPDPGGQPGSGTLPYFPNNPEGGQIYPGQSQPYYQQPYPQYQQPGMQTYPGGSFAAVQATRPAQPIDSKRSIMMRCVTGTQGSLSYTLSSGGNSFLYSMTAGQEQHFAGDADWIISFFDGVQQRRYRLLAGRTYRIKRNAEQVWQLFADK